MELEVVFERTVGTKRQTPITELIAVWGDELWEHEKSDVWGYERNIFLVKLIGSDRLDKWDLLELSWIWKELLSTRKNVLWRRILENLFLQLASCFKKKLVEQKEANCVQ